jgi:hypothetical protein
MTTVGREPELAEVSSALASAREGRGRLLVLLGEPGIGKTRLAEEAAARARDGGFRVVWGRAAEGGGAPPYWPWSQVLRTLVDEQAFSLPPRQLAHLVEILPDLGDAPPRGHGRFDVYEALISALRRSGPLLVVLDDLHAADEATLLALQLVARRVRELPLLLVATHREAEVRLRPSVDQLLARITREGTRLPLRRLTQAEVAQLLAPDATPERAAEVFRSSEGNPLFVQEIRCLLHTHQRERLPDGIRAAIADHVALLGADTRALLSTAALLGREFAVAALSAVSGAPTDAVAAALREAATAGVIFERGRSASFSHVLIAEVLAASLPPAERARLHLTIAEHLERSDGEAAAIAHHRLSSGSDVETALAWVRRAADEALRRFAADHAAALYARALELVDALPDAAAQRIDLLLRRSEALIDSVDTHAGREACLKAARLARELGAPELEARAALAYASHFTFGYVDPEMVPLLERALEHLGDGEAPLRARLQARLSAALEFTTEEVRIQSLGAAALDYIRRHDDPPTHMAVLDSLIRSGFRLTLGVEGLRSLSREVIALARTLDDRRVLFRAYGGLLRDELERGDLPRILEIVETVKQVTRADADPRSRGLLFFMSATVARLQGRFAECHSLYEDAAGNIALVDEEMAQALTPMHRWADAYVRGVPDPALGAQPLVPFARAWTQAMLGDLEAGRAALAGPAPPGNAPVRQSMRAELCLLVGDRARATEIDAALAPFDGRNAVVGPALFFGPTTYFRGGLHALLGDDAGAVHLFADAIAMCERLGAEPFLARTLAAAARVEPDAARAAEMRERARTIAERLDMSRLLDTIRALAPVERRAPKPAPSLLTLTRDGELWTLCLGEAVARLRDSKGLTYLDELVRAPHRELHVAQLVSGGAPAEMADAGPLLDPKARRQYETRLEDLEEELREAESFGDATRAARAETEIDALADELARAVGLGGRDRRAGALTERARVNVQRRLRDVLKRAADAEPRIGEHLRLAVKTGTYCSYSPPG